MKSGKEIDSGWAWIIALSSCWVNFSIYGLWRAYGVLYVAFMDNYNVNHQTASWPFTLCCAVYHLIGPIVGLLSHKFSLRNLQLVGCLVASLGVIFASLAKSFIVVIILIGAVQGLGLGVIRTLSNVVIQQYFMKHRATATGISMAGGTISSFFFPSFAEYILENYGLKISYLVFGSVMLQAVIGISLQRQPRANVGTETNGDISEANADQNNNSKNTDVKNQLQFTCNCFVEGNFIIDNDNIQYINCDKNVNHGESNYKCRCKVNDEEISIDREESSAQLLSQSSLSSMNETSSNNESDAKDELQTKIENAKSPLRKMLILLTQPMFFITCFTFVTYNICLQVYLMTIVDFALKEQVTTKSSAIFLITIFSVADLLGRLSFGWLSDKGFIRPKNLSIICLVILSTGFTLLPLIKNLLSLQILSVAIGLLIGIMTILWPILNVDYFGKENLAISLGLNCFFSGVESLLRPLLIGYYLDYLKRYDLLFFTLSLLTTLTMILWILEPIFNRRKPNRL